MKKYILHFLMSLVLIMTSCTGDFEEINTDPNNLVEATMPSILLKAQIEISHTFLDSNDVFMIGFWVQYYANGGYNDQPYDYTWNTNNIENGAFGYLKNLELLRRQAEKAGSSNYQAIAMIMMAWAYHNITDIYGDYPYSQAIQADLNQTFYPEFDSQESIYKDLVIKLKEACDMIDLSEPAISSSVDLYCGGDMIKWKRFANALRARLYLRMSNADPATAKAGLEEVFSNAENYPILRNNRDNVNMTYIEESDQGSHTCIFVMQAVKQNNTRRVSSFMVDLLCANDDPRRTIFLRPTRHSEEAVEGEPDPEAEEPEEEPMYIYKGYPAVIANRTENYDSYDISEVGNAISRDYKRPLDIFTYAELLFIRAEAAAKGFSVGGTAKDFYEKAILASMEKWGVEDEALIDKYMKSDFVKFDASKAEQLIITQRYIDSFQQHFNAFAFVRRSGKLQMSWNKVGFAKEHGYPDRLPYSENIRKYNPNSAEHLAKVTTNLWGKTWINTNITVPVANNYSRPVEYKFKDKQL